MSVLLLKKKNVLQLIINLVLLNSKDNKEDHFNFIFSKIMGKGVKDTFKQNYVSTNLKKNANLNGKRAFLS